MMLSKLGVGALVGSMAAWGTLGCGATTSPDDDEDVVTVPAPLARSGERLSAMAYQAGDAAQFRHFHDELYGFDCEFAIDHERTTRCFPMKTATVVYLDPSCRTPAARSEGLKTGDWVVGSGTQACPGELGTRGAPYVVGEQIYAESIVGSEGYEVYESTGTGACQLAYGQSKTNAEVRALVERSPRELVQGRIDSVDTNQGLRVQKLVAEDGAEANFGVVLADGTACHLERDGRCVGVPSLDGGRTCREPATAAAASGARLVRVGSDALHLELFELKGGGAAADAVFQFPAGENGKFLTNEGTSCSVWDAADGSLRCAAVDEIAEAGSWSDSNCTKRLYRLYDDRAGSQLSPAAVSELRYFRRDFDQDGHYQIVAVGSLKAHEGPAFTLQDQECVPTGTNQQLLALDQDLGIESLPLVRSTRLE